MEDENVGDKQEINLTLENEEGIIVLEDEKLDVARIDITTVPSGAEIVILDAQDEDDDKEKTVNIETPPLGPGTNGKPHLGPGTDGTPPLGPVTDGTLPLGPVTDGTPPLVSETDGTPPLVSETDGTPPLGPGTDGTPPLGPVTDGTPPLGPGSDGMPPLGPGTDGMPPLGPVTDVTPPLGPVTDGTPPLGPVTDETPPLGPVRDGTPQIGPSTDGTPPLGPETDGTLPLGPETDGTPPLGPGTDVTPPLGPVTDVTSPLSPGTDGTLPLGPGTDETPPLGPETDVTSPLGPETDGTPPLAPGTDGTPQLSPGTDGTPPLSPGTDGTPPLSPGTDGTPPLSPGTDGTPPLSPGTDGTPPLSPGTDGTPPLSPGTDGTPLLSPGTDGTPPLSPRTDGTPPLSPGTDGTPPLSPETDVTSPLGPGTDGTLPLGPRTDGTPPLGPGTDVTSPLGPETDGTPPLSPGTDGTPPLGCGLVGTPPLGPGTDGTPPLGPGTDGTLPLGPGHISLSESVHGSMSGHSVKVKRTGEQGSGSGQHGSCSDSEAHMDRSESTTSASASIKSEPVFEENVRAVDEFEAMRKAYAYCDWDLPVNATSPDTSMASNDNDTGGDGTSSSANNTHRRDTVSELSPSTGQPQENLQPCRPLSASLPCSHANSGSLPLAQSISAILNQPSQLPCSSENRPSEYVSSVSLPLAQSISAILNLSSQLPCSSENLPSDHVSSVSLPLAQSISAILNQPSQLQGTSENLPSDHTQSGGLAVPQGISATLNQPSQLPCTSDGAGPSSRPHLHDRTGSSEVELRRTRMSQLLDGDHELRAIVTRGKADTLRVLAAMQSGTATAEDLDRLEKANKRISYILAERLSRQCTSPQPGQSQASSTGLQSLSQQYQPTDLQQCRVGQSQSSVQEANQRQLQQRQQSLQMPHALPSPSVVQTQQGNDPNTMQQQFAVQPHLSSSTITNPSMPITSSSLSWLSRLREISVAVQQPLQQPQRTFHDGIATSQFIQQPQENIPHGEVPSQQPQRTLPHGGVPSHQPQSTISHGVVTSQQPQRTLPHGGVPSQQLQNTISHGVVPSQQPQNTISHGGVPSQQPQGTITHGGIPSQQYQSTIQHGGVPSQQPRGTIPHGGVPTQQLQSTIQHGGVPSQQPQWTMPHGHGTIQQHQRTIPHGHGTIQQHQRTISHGQGTSQQPQSTIQHGGVPSQQPQRTMSHGGVPPQQPQRTIQHGGVPPQQPQRTIPHGGVLSQQPHWTMSHGGVLSQQPQRTIPHVQGTSQQPQSTIQHGGVPPQQPQRAIPHGGFPPQQPQGTIPHGQGASQQPQSAIQHGGVPTQQPQRTIQHGGIPYQQPQRNISHIGGQSQQPQRTKSNGVLSSQLPPRDISPFQHGMAPNINPAQESRYTNLSSQGARPQAVVTPQPAAQAPASGPHGGDRSAGPQRPYQCSPHGPAETALSSLLQSQEPLQTLTTVSSIRSAGEQLSECPVLVDLLNESSGTLQQSQGSSQSHGLAQASQNSDSPVQMTTSPRSSPSTVRGISELGSHSSAQSLNPPQNRLSAGMPSKQTAGAKERESHARFANGSSYTGRPHHAINSKPVGGQAQPPLLSENRMLTGGYRATVITLRNEVVQNFGLRVLGLRCSHCDFTVGHMIAQSALPVLKQHLWMDHSLHQYQCRICTSFTSHASDEVLSHIKSKHQIREPEPFVTDILKMLLEKSVPPNWLKDAIKVQYVVQCKLCQVCIWDSKNPFPHLVKHMMGMHNWSLLGGFRCLLCNFTDSLKGSMLTHVASKHQTVLYHCKHHTCQSDPPLRFGAFKAHLEAHGETVNDETCITINPNSQTIVARAPYVFSISLDRFVHVYLIVKHKGRLGSSPNTENINCSVLSLNDMNIVFSEFMGRCLDEISPPQAQHHSQDSRGTSVSGGESLSRSGMATATASSSAVAMTAPTTASTAVASPVTVLGTVPTSMVSAVTVPTAMVSAVTAPTAVVSAMNFPVTTPTAVVSAMNVPVTATTAVVSAMNVPVTAPTAVVSAMTVPVTAPTAVVSAMNVPVTAPTAVVSAMTVPVTAPTAVVSAMNVPVTAPTAVVSAMNVPVTAPTAVVSAMTVPVTAPTAVVSAMTVPVTAPTAVVSAMTVPVTAPTAVVSAMNVPVTAPTAVVSAMHVPVTAPTAVVSGMAVPVTAPTAGASAMAVPVTAPTAVVSGMIVPVTAPTAVVSGMTVPVTAPTAVVSAVTAPTAVVSGMIVPVTAPTAVVSAMNVPVTAPTAVVSGMTVPVPPAIEFSAPPITTAYSLTTYAPAAQVPTPTATVPTATAALPTATAASATSDDTCTPTAPVYATGSPAAVTGHSETAATESVREDLLAVMETVNMDSSVTGYTGSVMAGSVSDIDTCRASSFKHTTAFHSDESTQEEPERSPAYSDDLYETHGQILKFPETAECGTMTSDNDWLSGAANDLTPRDTVSSSTSGFKDLIQEENSNSMSNIDADYDSDTSTLFFPSVSSPEGERILKEGAETADLAHGKDGPLSEIASSPTQSGTVDSSDFLLGNEEICAQEAETSLAVADQGNCKESGSLLSEIAPVVVGVNEDEDEMILSGDILEDIDDSSSSSSDENDQDCQESDQKLNAEDDDDVDDLIFHKNRNQKRSVSKSRRASVKTFCVSFLVDRTIDTKISSGTSKKKGKGSLHQDNKRGREGERECSRGSSEKKRRIEGCGSDSSMDESEEEEEAEEEMGVNTAVTTEGSVYKCDRSRCPYVTSNLTNLLKHKKTKHKILFKCRKCGYQTCLLRESYKHRHKHNLKDTILLKHTDLGSDRPGYDLLDLKFKCKYGLCGYQTTSRVHLDAHRFVHKNYKVFLRCVDCRISIPIKKGGVIHKCRVSKYPQLEETTDHGNSWNKPVLFLTPCDSEIS